MRWVTVNVLIRGVQTYLARIRQLEHHMLALQSQNEVLEAFCSVLLQFVGSGRHCAMSVRAGCQQQFKARLKV